MTPYDLSIDGWMEENELRWLYETAAGMQSVIEVGSYRGRSAFALLQGSGNLHAIDPWVDEADWRAFLDVQARLDMRGKTLRVSRMTSAEAAAKFSGETADMVFIDADHSYESVRQDIDLWLPRARRIICGHDYNNSVYPGVSKAVRERFGGGFTHPAGLIWAVQLG